MITHTVLRLGRSCRSRRAGARSACMRTSFRVERDSMGEIKVPAEALWGAHTQRAVQNFPVSGLTMPRPFIGALGLVKQAAVRVNRDLKLLEPKLAQELSGWRTQVESGAARLRSVEPRLLALAQGGTAVGTGINAHPEFGRRFCEQLAALTGVAFAPARNYFEALSAQDTAVELSGQLKVIAVSLMKIANDLRWMNSGPLAGLAEIALPALQPGSSIMPGKANPVIPEATTMVAAQVIGNDATITLAGQSGNFQLNVT